jgi:heme-degrading monooxygenase HmoA
MAAALTHGIGGGTLACTPTPPYYAVIFTSLRTSSGSDDGYGATAQRMVELAMGQPGYLGHESAREPGPDGLGITVSYWADTASIQAWRAHTEHIAAQDDGRAAWYKAYSVRVARVERAYDFETGVEAAPCAAKLAVAGALVADLTPVPGALAQRAHVAAACIERPTTAHADGVARPACGDQHSSGPAGHVNLLPAGERGSG